MSWTQAFVVVVGLAGTGGCVILGDGDDPGEGNEETDDGSGSSDGPGDSSSDAADETGTGEDTEPGGCEPKPESSCADVHAPSVRGLDNDEWLGISTDTISDLVFTTNTVTRTPPRPEHPAYAAVFIIETNATIWADLSEQTFAELTELAAPLESSIGVYGSGRDATIRLGDGQSCVQTGTDCVDHDALLDAAAAIDTALLEAWSAQDAGWLHPLETVDPQPWPLSLSWGKGGEFEVDQETWESLADSWYENDAGDTAHVRRLCLGSGDDCHTWRLRVSILERVSSTLSDEQHAQLLALMPWALVGLGIPVDGDDYQSVRDAQLLDFTDPDDPSVHHTITMVTQPSLVVDVAL